MHSSRGIMYRSAVAYEKLLPGYCMVSAAIPRVSPDICVVGIQVLFPRYFTPLGRDPKRGYSPGTNCQIDCQLLDFPPSTRTVTLPIEFHPNHASPIINSLYLWITIDFLCSEQISRVNIYFPIQPNRRVPYLQRNFPTSLEVNKASQYTFLSKTTNTTATEHHCIFYFSRLLCHYLPVIWFWKDQQIHWIS